MNNDRIIRATAGDGYIKMAVITAKDTVQRGCSVHGCSPTASAALGRLLARGLAALSGLRGATACGLLGARALALAGNVAVPAVVAGAGTALARALGLLCLAAGARLAAATACAAGRALLLARKALARRRGLAALGAAVVIAAVDVVSSAH